MKELKPKIIGKIKGREADKIIVWLQISNDGKHWVDWNGRIAKGKWKYYRFVYKYCYKTEGK